MSGSLTPRRYCLLLVGATLFLALSLSQARAEQNGTSKTNTEIVRTTSGVNSGMIGTRISQVFGPEAQSQGTSGGGGGGGTGSGDESQPGPGEIPGSKYLVSKAPGKAYVVPNAFHASSLYGNVESPSQWLSYASLAMGALAEQKKQDKNFLSDRLGVWTLTSGAWMSNTASSTRFSGNLFSLMGGADYRLREDLVVGTALGYEYLYLKTNFNAGKLYENGFTVMPYACYSVTPNTLIDSSFGLTFASYDTRRNDGAADGSFNATRSVWSANVTQYYQLENWTFSGRVGHIYSNEYRPQYRESDNTLNKSMNIYLAEFQFAGRVGYTYQRFSPYVGATYLWDYAMRTPSSVDPDEVQGTLGLNVMATDRLMLNTELANSFFRDNTYNTRLSLTLRYAF